VLFALFGLLPLHRVVEAIGPTRLHQLFRPDKAQFPISNIAGDGATCRHDGIRSDPDRSDQRAVGTDERAPADFRLMLEIAVVVTGDRASANIGPCPDIGITQISQVIGLRAFAQNRVLDLYEIADARAGFQHSAGPQAREGADGNTGADARALKVAEGVDCCAIGHFDTGPEHDIGFNRDIAAQPGVPAEEYRFRRGKADAIRHRFIAAKFLPLTFRGGQFGAAVDAAHLCLIRFDERAGSPVRTRFHHHVRQVVFTSRIFVADAAQQSEQVRRGHCHHAGITEVYRTFRLARVLEFDHAGNGAAIFADDPAIGARIGSAEGQDNGGGRVCFTQAAQHPAHRGGGNEGHIAVKHQHVTGEACQRRFRLLHRVACAKLRFLQNDRRAVAHRALDLIAAVACDNDSMGRFERGYTGQQMFQHRPPGDGVEHLVERAFHPGALAGGEDHDCKWGGRGIRQIIHANGNAIIPLPFPYSCGKATGMTDFPFAIVGFDLDGTLVDSNLDLAPALNHALASLGRDAIPADATRRLIGGGAGQMLKRGLELTGGELPDAEFDAAHRVLLDHYEAHIADYTVPYPGCLDALDALAARGVTLAVVTNKIEAYARKLLDALGMSERFACIIGGDTLGPGRSKPAPDMIEEAIRQCGGGSFAMVGDSTFDVLAARNAGVPVVALSFGYNDVPPEELGADTVIDRYDDLVGALEALTPATA